MVFCGRPSKACQRCRDRKLRCDLRSGSCGQCFRAQVNCSGYRDTQQLRIRNESQAVRRKAFAKNEPKHTPRSLSMSLELQARDAFFTSHVNGTSKTWDFLLPFYDPTNSPEHLTLSIDAVSLAYLSHQVYSYATLATARERYVSALHMTNKALQSPELVAKDTTLLALLLLDLFEKVTNNRPRGIESWKCHVNGALALVRFRGIEQFKDPSAIRVLVRLSTNFLISCVASATQVPEELNELRSQIGKHINDKDPKWRLSELMVEYANLRSNIQRGHSSIDSSINLSMKLDARLQALALDMPPSWQYKTTILEYESERIWNDHFDSYTDRHSTQTWNVLRLVRVLLNEFVLESCLTFAGDAATGACSSLAILANDNIETLAREICASVPQYVDCFGAARGMLPTPEESERFEPVDSAFDRSSHLHSPSQIFDCYTLIFPLYVAGRWRGSPNALQTWVIKQLHYMSSHFGICNAELVSQMLEQVTGVNPWSVYAKLGSYAFAA